MFGKLKSGSLISASWQIVKKEKGIIISQVIGAVAWLVVFALGVLVVYNLGTSNLVMDNGTLSEASFDMSPIGIIFSLFLIILLSVITHIVSAFVLILALARFRSEPVTSSMAIDKLKSRLKGIILFSLLSSTVGLLLNILQDRIPFLGGKIVAWLGSVAWAIASMFGLAVAVDQGQDNPVKAVKESAGIVKKTFGDNIKINIVLLPIVLLGVLLTFVVSALTGVLVTTGGLSDTSSIIFTGSVFTVALVVTMILTSSIQAVIQAGLYEYAISGKTPENFNAEMFKSVITDKKAKKIFGRA